MPSVGQQLRSERERRGLKRVDVARATKIGAHHLAALEHDDFAALPDTVFAKGFVRSYAEHLGLDVEQVLAEFALALDRVRPAPAPDEQPEVVREMSRILAKKRRVPRRGALLALGAGLALVALALLAWSRPAPQTPPVAAERPRAEPAPARPLPEAESAPSPQGDSRLSGTAAEAGQQAPTTVPESRPSPLPPLPEPEPPPAQTAPPKEEPPRPVPAPPAEPSRLSISDHGVGTAVRARTLVGRAETFREGTTVWFFTRVLGARRGEIVHHLWLHDGREVKRVELELGGPHWRTQSREPLARGAVGPWAVEARDAAGELLARDEFVCVAP